MSGLVSLLGNFKVRVWLAVLVACFLAIATFGIHQGIEFQGGVRIPISLEKKVDSEIMSVMVDTIKTRINKFGLSQSVVRPLGDKEIMVEIPQADAKAIESVQRILRDQGHFEAIIDGQVALEGSDIIPSAIGGPQAERVFQSASGYSWELDFVSTPSGAQKFSQAALGKADFPVNMFLDRPENSIIVLNRSLLSLTRGSALALGDFDEAIAQAVKKTGGEIPVFYVEDLESGVDSARLTDVLAQGNFSKAIVSKNLSQLKPKVAQLLQINGLNLSEFSDEDLTPVIETQQSVFSQSRFFVSRWKAIGLLSGPLLSGGLADGNANQFYRVTGSASGLSPEEQHVNAKTELKELKTVLSSGRLPVNVVIGSSFTIAPTLGEQFLAYSWIGVIFAIIAVSLFIIVRYKSAILAAPIILINASEILITMTLISVIGTLDLSAMAGIISLMGTGVGDQIILTDELLRGRKQNELVPRTQQSDLKDRVQKGFKIIVTNAGVAILAMIPLLMSGIIEIQGFALSVIFGILVGVIITRPAFAEIVSEVVAKKRLGHEQQ